MLKRCAATRTAGLPGAMAPALLACALGFLLCASQPAAQVASSMNISPVIAGQTGNFTITLSSPNPVHGINGRMVYDSAMMQNTSLTLNAGQPGFTFAQNSTSAGEICFVLYKNPPDAALNLANPVLNLTFTAPSGLIGSAYATLEILDDAAARIMTDPPQNVISVTVGGPGGNPQPKKVEIGTFAIPLVGRPVISPNPSSQSVNAGFNVVFSIAASGPSQPFTYQWFGPSGLISGANTPTYQINTVTTGHAGLYRCDVTNVAGTSSSSDATLTVNSPAHANAATFVSHSIPNPSYANETIGVGITFRNTSDLTWNQAQGYSLAVTSDPAGLFGGATRIPLNSAQTVIAPNTNALFLPFLDIPATPGNYSATVRMVQEFVEFFGPSVPLNVNVIQRPNAAASWETYE